MGIGVIDGKCGNFLDSIGTLTQLTDLRIGLINSSLDFVMNLSQLIRLDLKNVKSKSGLDFLNEKPNLRYFIIYQGKFASYTGINRCSNLVGLTLGYLRNFANDIVDESFDLQQLKALELSCLPKLTSISFLSDLKRLEYLEMNSLKRLQSLSPLAHLNLRYLRAGSFVPLDKKCHYLDKMEFVGIDSGYDISSKEYLVKQFKGDSLFIGKYLKKGVIDIVDVVISYKAERLLEAFNQKN